jgi:hypothetical protein
VEHRKSQRKLVEACHENFLSALRMREWRDIHSQLHALAAEQKWQENQVAGDLRRDPPRAARRPARQHRLQVGGFGALPRRARHQVPDPSRIGAAEEGRQVDRRRRDQRNDAPFRALRRAHRTGVAGAGRRAPAQAQLVRPALGEEGDAGGRFRAHHALRHRRRSAPAGELRAAESVRRRARSSSVRRWSAARSARSSSGAGISTRTTSN